MYLVTVCACHIEIKGYLLTYLLTCVMTSASVYIIVLTLSVRPFSPYGGILITASGPH